MNLLSGSLYARDVATLKSLVPGLESMIRDHGTVVLKFDPLSGQATATAKHGLYSKPSYLSVPAPVSLPPSVVKLLETYGVSPRLPRDVLHT